MPLNLPWMVHAYALLGTQEIHGSKHNDAVVKLWNDGRIDLKVTDDETPWCAAFVSACLERAGIKSARTGWARGHLKWGYKLTGPIPGCLVIFSRGPNAGHVAFVVGKDANGNLMCLGGNQGDKVSVAPFGTDRVLGYRWPADVVTPTKPGFASLAVVQRNGAPLSTNEA